MAKNMTNVNDDMIAINSSDDFRTWASKFLQAIRSNGAYTAFISQATDFIYLIISSNSLPYPVSEETRYFIDEFIPTVISELLKISSIKINSEDFFHSFFFAVHSLCIWGFENDNLELASLVTDITDLSKPLFLELIHFWKRIVESIASSVVMSKMLKRMINTEAFPTERHFQIYFNFLFNLSVNKDIKLNVEYIIGPYKLFCQYLGGFNQQSIRNSNTNILETTTARLIELSLAYIDAVEFDFNPIFDFAEFCIHLGILEKQILGIIIFSKFTANEKIIAIFLKWPKSKDLIHYLSSSYFHSELLKRTASFFNQLAYCRVLDQSVYRNLWNRSMKAHESEKEDLSKLFIGILNCSASDVVTKFFDEIEIRHEPGFYKFATYVIQMLFNHEDSSKKMIKILFDLSKTEEMARQALHKASSTCIINEFNNILNFCLENLHDQLACQLVVELINNCLSINVYFDSDFLPTVLLMIPQNPDGIYKILTAYLAKSGTTVTEDMLTQMIEFGIGDSFWKFVLNLFLTLGIQAFSYQALNIIFSKISDYITKDSSLVFAKALCMVFDSINIYNGFVTNEKKYTTVLLIGLNLLFSLYFVSSDRKVCEEMENYIIQVFINFQGIDLDFVTNCLNGQLSPYMNNETKKCLIIINRFIHSIEDDFELSDFGIKRHKDLNEKFIKVKVFGCGLEKELLFKNEVTQQSVKTRMKLFLQFTDLDVDISDLNHININAIGEYTTLNLPKLPSLTMYSMLFTSYLFKLLNNPDLASISYQLLTYLPCDPMILNQVKDQSKFISDLYNVESKEEFKYMFTILVSYIQIDKLDTNDFQSIMNLYFEHPEETSILTFLLDIANKDFSIHLFDLMPLLIGDEPKAEHISMIKYLATFDETFFIENLSQILDFHMMMDLLEYSFLIDYVNKNALFEYLQEKIPDSINLLIHTFDRFNMDFSKLTEKLIISEITDSYKLLHLIFNHQPNLVSNYKDLQQKLVQKIFKSNNINETDAMIDVLSDITKDKRIKIQFPSLSFKDFPSLLTERSVTGYLGLRNLGATCFMNAILQQLFFIIPFRNKILKQTNFLLSDQQELQMIFSRLLLSQKQFVDTSDYCSKWKGWNNQLINTREQQDSYEFFEHFLDQLSDDFKSFFQGLIVNKMEGTNDTNEQFYGISLDVKGHQNIEESIVTFSQPNYVHLTETNSDVYKITRIKKVPEVLVFRLKRFEYDMNTGNKVKINSKFEFSQEINIKTMLDQPQDMIYKLQGIVLHSGVVQSGHYTSLIKLDGKWVKFNDKTTSYVTETEVKTDSIGYSSTSAYILFYVRSDEKQEIQNPSDQIVQKIKFENAQRILVKNLINPKMIDYVSKNTNSHTMTKFFYNIVLRYDNQEVISSFADKLLILLEQENQQRWLFKYLMKYFDDLIQIFKETISYSGSNVISVASTSLQPEDVVEFYSNLVNSLSQFLVSWRQIPLVTQALLNVSDPQFEQIIVNFIYSFYDIHETNDYIIENCDLSDLFDYLARIDSIADFPFNEKITRSIKNKIHYLNYSVKHFPTVTCHYDLYFDDPRILRIYFLKGNKDMTPVFSSFSAQRSFFEMCNSIDENLRIALIYDQTLTNLLIIPDAVYRIKAQEILISIIKDEEDREIIETQLITYLLPAINNVLRTKYLSGLVQQFVETVAVVARLDQNLFFAIYELLLNVCQKQCKNDPSLCGFLKFFNKYDSLYDNAFIILLNITNLCDPPIFMTHILSFAEKHNCFACFDNLKYLDYNFGKYYPQVLEYCPELKENWIKSTNPQALQNIIPYLNQEEISNLLISPFFDYFDKIPIELQNFSDDTIIKFINMNNILTLPQAKFLISLNNDALEEIIQSTYANDFGYQFALAINNQDEERLCDLIENSDNDMSFYHSFNDFPGNKWKKTLMMKLCNVSKFDVYCQKLLKDMNSDDIIEIFFCIQGHLELFGEKVIEKEKEDLVFNLCLLPRIRPDMLEAFLALLELDRHTAEEVFINFPDAVSTFFPL